MKKLIVIIFSLLLTVTATFAKGKDTNLPKANNYRTFDPAIISLLQDLRQKASTCELNSVILLKDGKKILEYYDVCYGPQFLNICWSVSKTFTATAIGFAVQEGRLSVDDKLVKYLRPEQLPDKVSDTLANLTIHDLLRMASGLKKDAVLGIGDYNPAVTTKSLLEAGFRFAPGTQYKYNSFNSYLLSVVLTNITGETVEEYLTPRLFKPLGIKNHYWDKSLEGYSMGGWGLYITSESFAKMGQFLLQKGRWNGKQLLNSEWVEKATSAQIMQNLGTGIPDRESGYCYQMWRGPHNSVRLDGAHGQYSIILPDDNAVIVLTGNHKSTDAVRAAIWKNLYPLVKSDK